MDRLMGYSRGRLISRESLASNENYAPSVLAILLNPSHLLAGVYQPALDDGRRVDDVEYPRACVAGCIASKSRMRPGEQP